MKPRSRRFTTLELVALHNGRSRKVQSGSLVPAAPSAAIQARTAAAAKRMEQLASIGGDVAAMCPICLVNLRNAAEGKDVTVRDISEYLVRAYAA